MKFIYLFDRFERRKKFDFNICLLVLARGDLSAYIRRREFGGICGRGEWLTDRLGSPGICEEVTRQCP